MDINSLKQKIGQTFVIGFQGTEADNDVKKFITTNNIGGVILFTRNVEGPAQVGELTNELQSLVPKLPDQQQLIVSIDMEGGRVARLKPPFTQWPPMKILGEIGSPTLGFKFAESMAAELLAVGINLDYAPCVDIFTNTENKVIGDRAFGDEPEIVSKMASSIVRGFIKAGVIPCVKHFPGHGDTIADSHEELPIVHHDLKRLEEMEFVPFKKAFRARAPLVMTAHLKLEKVDPEWPATLSPKILQDILRKDCGFRGAIITDDMEMKAVFATYPIELAAVQSVKAGCNILLYCHTLEVQQQALDAIVKAVVDKVIPEAVIDANYKMMLQLKKDHLKPFVPVAVTEVAKIVGHPDHLKLSKAIAKKEVPADLAT